MDLEQYRGEVHDLVRATGDLELVFISESKRADWGLAGRVILPGIDLEDYGGYHGRDVRVLRVGNFMRQRDIMLGSRFSSGCSAMRFRRPCSDSTHLRMPRDSPAAGMTSAAVSEAIASI